MDSSKIKGIFCRNVITDLLIKVKKSLHYPTFVAK